MSCLSKESLLVGCVVASTIVCSQEVCSQQHSGLSAASGPVQEAIKMGDQYAAKQDFVRAVEQYTNAIKANPGDLEGLKKRAAAYRQLKKTKEAVLDLEQAIAISPRDFSSYFLCVNALVAEGQVEKAKALVKRAITKNQNDFELFVLRSTLQSDANLQLADLNTAVSLARTQAQPYANRGVVLFNRFNRSLEAIRDLTTAHQLKPTNPWILTERAKVWLSLGEVGKAISDCERALRLEPTNVDAHFQLGRALVRERQFDNALAHLDQVIVLQPSNALAFAERGELLLTHMKKMRAAETDLNESIRLGPNPIALLNRALFFKLDKQPEKARIDLEQAITMFGNQCELVCHRIGLQEGVSMIVGDRYYNRLENNKALEQYNKAVAADPNNGYALARRGRAYQRLEKYELAEKDLHRALQLCDKNGRIYLDLACIKFGQLKHQDAVDLATKGLAIETKNDFGYFVRSQAKSNLHDYKGALADITTAIALNPGNGGYHGLRGWLLGVFEKKPQEALVECNKAHQLCPHDVAVLVRRAAVLRAVGKYDLADRDLAEASRLAPKEKMILTSRLDLHSSRHMDGKTLMDLDELLKLEPNNRGYHEKRKEIYLAQKNWPRVAAELDALAPVDSGDSTSRRLERAKVLSEELRNYPEAIKELSQAIKADPKSTVALLRRAELYRKAAKYDLALQEIATVLKLDRDNADAYIMRAQIKEEHLEGPDAVADYTNALRVRPLDKVALFGRARTYLDSENAPEKALADLNVLASISPAFAKETRFSRAACYRALGRHKESIQLLEQLANDAPKDYWVRFELGKQLIAGKQWARAIEIYKEINALQRAARKPSEAGYLGLGTCYLNTGQMQLAQQSLTRAIEIHPRSIEAYRLRSEVFCALKQYERAELDCSKVISLQPAMPQPLLARAKVWDQLGKTIKAESDRLAAKKLSQAWFEN